MCFNTKVEQSSNVDAFVGSFNLALDAAKGAWVIVVTYLLCTQAAPFSIDGLQGLRDALAHVSGDILRNGTIYGHALESFDTLDVAYAIVVFDMRRNKSVMIVIRACIVQGCRGIIGSLA